MDFDFAAQRFARDQNKLRARQQQQHARKTAVSAKAQREIIQRKQQQARLLKEKRAQERRQRYIQNYIRECDGKLQVQEMKEAQNLTATSIHGEGDKIALPPSILETLTSEANVHLQAQTPWTFRIAIRNPKYQFPASQVIQQMKAPPEKEEEDEDNEDPMDVDVDVDDLSDDEDGDRLTRKVAAYQQELRQKYLAFTYGTVVEFTQEEGHVGLPASIAQNLLKQAADSHENTPVPFFRTVDPAASATTTKEDDQMESADDANHKNDTTASPDIDIGDTAEKTPGHIAYGAFDLPRLPLEISLVQLPKGRACTLVPTEQAIQNNFYGVKDIKLMLEQSLIRTRAVLAIGDLVHAWHRGIQYNVRVKNVTPAAFGAVSIINTDLTVDFGQDENDASTEAYMNEESKEADDKIASNPSNDTSGNISGGGYTLGGSRPNQQQSSATDADKADSTNPKAAEVLLPVEPPVSAANVLIVQIRSSSGGSVQRRLSITDNSLRDLFAVAQSIVGTTNAGFRLVTRFPRRIWEQPEENDSTSLQDAGFSAGKELLMVEFL